MNEYLLHSGLNCNLIENIEKKNNDDALQIINFLNPPYIVSNMSVVGSKEGKGNFHKYFDKIISDDKMGEKSFEKAEFDIMMMCVHGGIEKANLTKKDIDILIAGDLLNQIISSSYIAREMGMSYLGVYSACATMSESLILAGILCDSHYFKNIACATVSHFATAERQYRYPLEYGCQRPPYAQWTVTGGGCTILSSIIKSKIKLTKALIGRVIDYGINDLNNMGAAMAPSAVDTLVRFFTQTNTMPCDYDLIVTGDLGKLGSDIFRDLMREKGFELFSNYMDCGASIYSVNQKCYQGGSGAGCCACVLNSFILSKMNDGVYKKVIFLPTGALMSPTSCFQGETIPAICHCVLLEGI